MAKITVVTLAALNAALTYLRGKLYTKTETDTKITEEIGKIKPYELASKLGGVKAGGAGITIAADGTVSANTAAAATAGIITEARVGELAQAEVNALQLKTVNGQSIKGSGDITIDLSLYKVVSALPTADIDGDKIYLVADTTAPEGNKYKEYVYVDGKWELLGEYKAAVDLKPITDRLDTLEAFDANLEFMDETSGATLATSIFG